MSTEDPRFERTRRAVLRAAASALGIGAAGTSSGYPGEHDADGGSVDGSDDEPFGLDDGVQFENTAAVGYHSIGRTGPAGSAGTRPQRHDGDRQGEIDVQGDVAAIAFRGADGADPGRRLAVLDVSEFNAATTAEELAEAELTVLGILRNVNAEANGATDVRLSYDATHAFVAT